MDESRLTTIAQIEDFLSASASIEFKPDEGDCERLSCLWRYTVRNACPNCPSPTCTTCAKSTLYQARRAHFTKTRVRDIRHGDRISPRAMVMQQKTGRPVQFEITQPTREAVGEWIKEAVLNSDDYLFPSRIHESPHLGTRQYARIVDSWVKEIGLDQESYGTHSMRRTKASLIYRRTKNIRAVQLLLGHSKLESTVRYLGIEVEDALEMAEQTEI